MLPGIEPFSKKRLAIIAAHEAVANKSPNPNQPRYPFRPWHILQTILIILVVIFEKLKMKAIEKAILWFLESKPATTEEIGKNGLSGLIATPKAVSNAVSRLRKAGLVTTDAKGVHHIKQETDAKAKQE